MPALLLLFYALLWGNPAPSALASEKPYSAYWLIRENQPNYDHYFKLLVTRASLRALTQGRVKEDTPVLEAPALLVDTHTRTAVWNQDRRPLKPVIQAENLDEKTRRIQINGTAYRYESCPVEDVIRLLEKPEGTQPIHRLHAPLSGMERTARGLLLLLKASLSRPEKQESTLGQGRYTAPFRSQEQQIGPWKAWVQMTLHGSVFDRALRFRQTVYRQGPQDSAPVQVFEEISTGRILMRLRYDGTLVVQGVGKPLGLYFPDPKIKPLTLKLPSPKQWKGSFPPAMDFRTCLTWLDDVLFYGRETFPGYLIGYVRVDATRGHVVENRLCLEVAPPFKENIFLEASIDDVPPVRIGDYIFWRSRGAPKGVYPEDKKASKVRVYNLKTRQLLSLYSVPAALLEANRAKLSALQIPE